MKDNTDSDDQIAQAIAKMKAPTAGVEFEPNAFLAALGIVPRAVVAPAPVVAAEDARAALLERWRAHVAAARPPYDAGDFVTWETNQADDSPVGFECYDGEPWARLSDHAHERDLLERADARAAFTDDERAFVASKRTNESWVSPVARRWVLLEDTGTPSPLVSLDDEDDEREYVTTYRANLPRDMRDLGVVVGHRAGANIHIALWFGAERTPRQIESWLRAFDPTERFDIIREPRRNLTWLPLAPVRKAAPARKAAFTIHTTGIPPLDALLATGGLPRGARMYCQADTAQGKSVFDLHIGEHFADDGLRVTMICTSDESVESINARRLQRIGYTRADALRLALEGDAVALGKLNPNLTLVDGATTYLEDVIASAPDLIICDPIQKIRTRAGGGDTYTLESTAAAVKVAERSGITFVCASSKVKRAGRDLEASYGGASIPNGATLQIDLERDGTVINGRILKSRYGGEEQSFNVTLDGERQTLATPPVAPEPVSETEANRQAQVLAALKGGPKTAGALRKWVAGHNRELKAALDALVAAREIVPTGKEYALKDASLKHL